MNNILYRKVFEIPEVHIVNFIHIMECFWERKLLSEQTMHYDFSSRMFRATLGFPDGEDYKMFHNIVTSFMIGIKAL